MQLNHLKIGPRLALGFGIVVGLMAVIVALTMTRLAHIKSANADALQMQQRAAMADEWRGHVNLNASRALAIAKADGNAAVDAFFAPQMKATSERISTLQKALTEAVDSGEGKALLAQIGAQREVYVTARADVLKKFKDGDAAGGQALLDEKMVPAAAAYVGAIEAIARFQQERVKLSAAEVEADMRQAEIILVGSLVLATLLAVAFGWAITRSVTLPLQRTVLAAQTIASGNLAEVIRVDGRDEMAAMQTSLAGMQDSLRRLVSDVMAGSESIGTASAQIATGNQDLSGRTEQTASSLQQAASSLEQLTGTVGQTADSARTANQLAASASTAAERGGAVVAQVVATMEDINTSSKRIADIIGTIDGIAFQTNILALNAAVEAARAGEQGRGFAVVASEVRSLAQRSAEAAREIKGLIQTSVEKVDAGTRLVRDAGTAMDDIVGGVRRVTDVIGEISAATTEQSTGLRQVNEAVAGLDQMTQQNAALVEESAAAAESLSEQTTRLAGLVGNFRVRAA
ncbi:MAG: methyl-accepting chemotaxis protein [Rubrivivax sp.]|nr:methyl-accepting chemotaxis protein [Rubrivivax sp.]